jgi:hypothetical protein
MIYTLDLVVRGHVFKYAMLFIDLQITVLTHENI